MSIASPFERSAFDLLGLREHEDAQAFDHLAPADDRDDHREAVPHVVERRDDRAEKQIREAVDEHAGLALALEQQEQLGPGARLDDVRETEGEVISAAKISTPRSTSMRAANISTPRSTQPPYVSLMTRESARRPMPRESPRCQSR